MYTITDYSDMSSDDFHMIIVNITPQIAHEWMKLNRRNRTFSDRNAGNLESDLRGGYWFFDGMPIRFDKDGNLIDGQHRLTAISRLDENIEPIPLVVMVGLDSESQFIMDQGAKRSSAQQLSLESIPHNSLIAAGVKWYLVHRAGLMYSDNKRGAHVSTTPRIQEFVRANPWVVQVAETINSSLKGKAYPFTPSASFAVALLGWQVSPEVTIEFFQALKEGGVHADHPANRLRNWGLNNSDKNISARDEMALLIEHWNKTLKRQPMKAAPRLWTSAEYVYSATNIKKDKPTRFDFAENFPAILGLEDPA